MPDDNSDEPTENAEDQPVEAQHEPTPDSPASDDDGSVQDVAHGFYWVRPGDTAAAASERIYGTADASRLTPTNPPAPGFAMSDHSIRTIDVPGKITSARDGEDAAAVLKRMGVSVGKRNLAKFHAFNGGEGRVLKAGNLVFMPGDH